MSDFRHFCSDCGAEIEDDQGVCLDHPDAPIDTVGVAPQYCMVCSNNGLKTLARWIVKDVALCDSCKAAE